MSDEISHPPKPIIEARGVSYLDPQGLQQLPVETVPPREGLALGEQEADRVVPREADVAVRPVRHVLHQPLGADQSRAVEVEGPTCHRDNSTLTQNDAPKPDHDINYFACLSVQVRVCGRFPSFADAKQK